MSESFFTYLFCRYHVPVSGDLHFNPFPTPYRRGINFDQSLHHPVLHLWWCRSSPSSEPSFALVAMCYISLSLDFVRSPWWLWLWALLIELNHLIYPLIIMFVWIESLPCYEFLYFTLNLLESMLSQCIYSIISREPTMTLGRLYGLRLER